MNFVDDNNDDILTNNKKKICYLFSSLFEKINLCSIYQLNKKEKKYQNRTKKKMAIDKEFILYGYICV